MKKHNKQSSSKSIIVTGDITLDSFRIEIKNNRFNRTNSKIKIISRILNPGGAFLIADTLSQIEDSEKFKIISPIFIKKKLLELLPEEVVTVESPLEYDDDKKSFFIKGITEIISPSKDEYPLAYSSGNKIVKFPETFTNADAIIISDGGYGYSDSENLFPTKFNKDTYFFYISEHIDYENRLWNFFEVNIKNRKLNPQKLFVITTADEIRRIGNAAISRTLSWERSSSELMFNLFSNPKLQRFNNGINLIVLFETDGAVLYRNNNTDSERLLMYDANRLEGDFEKEVSHHVFSQNLLFTSSFVHSFLLSDSSKDSIITGLNSVRQFIENGFKEKQDGIIPAIDINDKSHNYYEVEIPKPNNLKNPDPDYWTILETKAKDKYYDIAINIVTKGKDEVLSEIPEMSFGKNLKTSDRTEIETYSGIRKLIEEYIENPSPKKPLSIAVFGSPGSGKSFAVKQIAGKIAGDRLVMETYNLTQINDPNELMISFHNVREIVLSGKIPLIFYDEFDTNKLEWLKEFLAPMQDGEFIDRHSKYHLGKVIFIFAGGVYESFDEVIKELEIHKDKKLPDFISRLSGFLNITGPNPRTFGNIKNFDESYVIRRAKVIRRIFEKIKETNGKDLFNHEGKILNIDRSVLRALLKIPEYKHGNRSIETIMNISNIAHRNIFDKTVLPIEEQLNAHVDSNIFFTLISKDRFLSFIFDKENQMDKEMEIILKIAEAMHNDYISQRKKKKERIDVPEKFSDLTGKFEEYRNSNIDAAEDVIPKLNSVNIGIRKAKDIKKVKEFTFEDDEIERLADREHERWIREKRMAGWSYGKTRDNVARKHPDMIPYKDLTEEKKDYDREQIRLIPRVMRELGFEMYRKT